MLKCYAPNTAVVTHIRENEITNEHGVHTEMIKGRPAAVERDMNAFLSRMQGKYPDTFKVLSTNSTPMPNGVCMYITYEC